MKKKTKYEGANPEFLYNYKFCGEPDCTELISKNKTKMLATQTKYHNGL